MFTGGSWSVSPNRHAVWEGSGPARSRARTEYTLKATMAARALTIATSSMPRWGPLERSRAERWWVECPSVRPRAHLQRLRALLHD